MSDASGAPQRGYRPRGFAQKGRGLVREALMGIGRAVALVCSDEPVFVRIAGRSEQRDSIVVTACQIEQAVEELIDVNVDVDQIKALGRVRRMAKQIQDLAAIVRDSGRDAQSTVERIPIEAPEVQP